MRPTLISLAALVLLAGSASAGTVVLTDRPGHPGGEFLATVIDPADFAGHVPGESFVTFCLERREYIHFNRVYDVEISEAARAGGGGSVNGKDDLDPRTAYLYTLFRKGLLDGYDYVNRSTANDLQRAIWYIEEEVSTVSGRAGTWVSDATRAVNQGIWTEGLGDVRVMNLTYRGHPAQDQLMMAHAPLPTTALAGFALLAGLGAVRAFRVRRRPRSFD